VAAPSLNERQFSPIKAVEGGEADERTVFCYTEYPDGMLWGVFTGGAVRRGYLIGTRAGDTLNFRYVQLNGSGETASGHCVSTIVELPDGRLRLEETWAWESKPGQGTSVAEELPPDPPTP
jgi:hypothetical protein